MRTVCSERAIERWRKVAGVDGGYLFRSVSQGEVVGTNRMHVSSVARINKQAVAVALYKLTVSRVGSPVAVAIHPPCCWS